MASLRELAAYDVSPARGFLPARDPLESLPAPFAAWERAAADLPCLLAAGEVRRLLGELPLLATAPLGGEAEWRRAMLLLSFLGHAWVWGEDPPARRLPRALAIPWAAVAARLGRPPVLSYASYALDNWRRLDPGGPLDLENLALLQHFLGDDDEAWFILVHVAIEARAAPILRELPAALAAAARGDVPELTSSLRTVAATTRSLGALLARMPERCDPTTYYRRVRPFIHGWANHPALPEGLVYEGVLEGLPQRLRGETGAQSGLVPVLDALLGVAHADDPLRVYLREMRDYMPPAHRALVEAVEGESRVRACALAARSGELAPVYDACLEELHAFRALHLEYAARYVAEQAELSRANPTALGTGGTPFMRYLAKHRDETAAHRLAESAPELSAPGG